MISVIVPTIRGREHWLERCQQAYSENTWHEFEFIVIHDHPTCNSAWNEGIRQAKGEFIHLSADDLEPHSGWDTVGLSCLGKGFLPCPRVLNADGSLQSCGSDAYEHETGTSSDVARVPLFPRALLPAIYPIFDGHYAGDYWVTSQGRKVGWPTVVVREMLFTHHMASEGRLHTLDADWAAFQAAL